jgi:hypothetical protein
LIQPSLISILESSLQYLRPQIVFNSTENRYRYWDDFTNIPYNPNKMATFRQILQSPKFSNYTNVNNEQNMLKIEMINCDYITEAG